MENNVELLRREVRYRCRSTSKVTILQALKILEDATLECKERSIDTPEVKEALDLLQVVVRPDWLVPQFRDRVAREDRSPVSLEGQQQVLRATFPGIRRSIVELLGKQMDKLARQYAKSQDPKVKAELERLSLEHGKLSAPWVFHVV
jgi:hypothetical protein